MLQKPDQIASSKPALLTVLGDEGFRVFFPLGAVYAAIWPLQWVLVFGFDLPFARTTPPGLWHAHEMIFGAFGAALLGFITTAIPEWTDTPKPQHRTLFALAGLWGIGRAVGFLGADALNPVGALADAAWLGWLAVYVARVSWAKRTDRLLAFVGWLGALLATLAIVRFGFQTGDVGLAQFMLHNAGLVFLGLLGLVLSRITVPVSNLVLDPTEQTSPFRPHPGRRHLAPGLVALAVAGELAGLSPAVSAFLMIAAGAAFMDRIGEAFVGREALRAEILVLVASSAFAGTGLLLVGAARLGAPFAEVAGLHAALMGGLGTGVLAVYSIAGLLHTGQKLVFPRAAKLGFACAIAAVLLRVLPDLGLVPHPPGPPYGAASLLWASAFLLWLRSYWPLLRDPATLGAESC